MMNAPTSPMSSPPKLSANEIEISYIQLRNSGWVYVGYLGEPSLISIEEWRERELKKASL
jgi:hypothetical protein